MLKKTTLKINANDHLPVLLKIPSGKVWAPHQDLSVAYAF